MKESGPSQPVFDTIISGGDMKKRVPEFRSEDQERVFWATYDSTDWPQACEPETLVAHDLSEAAGFDDRRLEVAGE